MQSCKTLRAKVLGRLTETTSGIGLGYMIRRGPSLVHAELNSTTVSVVWGGGWLIAKLMHVCSGSRTVWYRRASLGRASFPCAAYLVRRSSTWNGSAATRCACKQGHIQKLQAHNVDCM